MAEFFAGKEWTTFMQVLPTLPFETWETIWSTCVATLLALVIGLPLGVCLVTLLFQHAWALAAIVFGFAVLVFLAILFAEIISLGLETLTGLLSKFIFS